MLPGDRSTLSSHPLYFRLSRIQMTFNHLGAVVASLSMAERLHAKPKVSQVKAEKHAGAISR
jgi:hypothetical protein